MPGGPGPAAVDVRTEAGLLVDALLSSAPAPALASLELQDPSLRTAVAVARERLAAPGPDAVALLLAVSRFPGSPLAELAQHADVADPAAAGRELVEKGLATSTRFGRPDCWSRTAAGATLLRAAGPPPGPATAP